MNSIKYLILLSILALSSCSEKNKKNVIVALGDSNGAHEKGWVYHLQQLLPNDTIINYSISGNTIGFDNLGRKKLNTLRNINHVLTEADSLYHPIDKVLILLGTNDCKAVFKDSLQKVVENMQSLIDTIRNFNYSDNRVPDIIIISPPPYGSDSILIEKYKGAGKRVDWLVNEFRQKAIQNHLEFIDIYSPLKADFDTLATDGVHLTQEGYSMVAGIIKDHL